MRSWSVPASPGSSETLVIRTIGCRAKPSARAQPPEARRPIAAADSRLESAASSSPSSIREYDRPGVPSSSHPKDPRPPGSVASAVTFSSADP